MILNNACRILNCVCAAYASSYHNCYLGMDHLAMKRRWERGDFEKKYSVSTLVAKQIFKYAH